MESADLVHMRETREEGQIEQGNSAYTKPLHLLTVLARPHYNRSTFTVALFCISQEYPAHRHFPGWARLQGKRCWACTRSIFPLLGDAHISQQGHQHWAHSHCQVYEGRALSWSFETSVLHWIPKILAHAEQPDVAKPGDQAEPSTLLVNGAAAKEVIPE